jgi:glutamate 5-kinase
MSTKIVAARLATSAGVTTVITRSSNPGNIVDIVGYLQVKKNSQPATPSTPSSEAVSRAGEDNTSQSLFSLNLEGVSKPPSLHTRFMPDPEPMRDRYIWILHGLAPRGIVYIDEGAYHALVGKAGLLPAGIVDVDGTFAQQEAVRLVVKRLPPTGSTEKAKALPIEVGRAIVNYSSAEIARIKGIQSTEIRHVLGYADSEYVALRENIAFLKKERNSRPVTPSLATPVENAAMEVNA